MVEDGQQGQAKKVQFTYQYANDYRISHATGAWGGLTPQGYVKFDLYTEFGAPPTRETRPLNADGQLGDIEERSHEGGDVSDAVNVIRQMQVGVIMKPSDAERLAQWLLEKSEEARKSEEED